MYPAAQATSINPIVASTMVQGVRFALAIVVTIVLLLAMYIGVQMENRISAISLGVPAVFLVAIGLLAVAGPARRALRVDATEALREI